MAISVKFNGTEIAAELTELKRNSELLWSEGTGRAAESGLMVGSTVATKQTYSLKWGVLTQAQYEAIYNIPGGFRSLVITAGGKTLANITAYRGAVSSDLLETIGTTNYYKDVTIDFVER